MSRWEITQLPQVVQGPLLGFSDASLPEILVGVRRWKMVIFGLKQGFFPSQRPAARFGKDPPPN